MKITETVFDTFNKQTVKKITLTNDRGTSISLLNLGAIWNEFLVPSQSGQKNILLNFQHAQNYFDNPFYLGMAIGRTAGRIKNGQFTLDHELVTLPKNEGNNTLHGGPHGFNSFLWNYQATKNNNEASITFYRTILSTEDNYPGNLTATITYTLDNQNHVSLAFTGISDQTTVFNPTSHAYFNLSDKNDIKSLELTINSSEYLELSDDKIPTGHFIPVNDSPFDFQSSRQLGQSIEQMKNTKEKGFDDIYHVDNSKKIITSLTDQSSGRQLTISSARNGLVLFTSNSFTADMSFSTGAGTPYMGVALEAQTLPDSMNNPDFGDIILPANTKKTYTIDYQYTKK